jgi:hypothetical protein
MYIKAREALGLSGPAKTEIEEKDKQEKEA